MIRTIIQLEDGKNIYNVNDKVRVKMKSENPERASEYIGTIGGIHEHFITLNFSYNMTNNIEVDKIDRIRLAREGEDFNNTWNFDD